MNEEEKEYQVKRNGDRRMNTEASDCKIHESRMDSMEGSQRQTAGWTRAIAGIIVVVLLPLGGWASSNIITKLTSIEVMLVDARISAAEIKRDLNSMEKRICDIEDRNKYIDQQSGLFGKHK